MIQELTSAASKIKALEIDVAQKQNLLELLQALEKQVKTYDFRLQRANKDKVTLTTLLNRTSEDLDEERRKVEAANRAKSDFLATMSHEIRTPLNATNKHASAKSSRPRLSANRCTHWAKPSATLSFCW